MPWSPPITSDDIVAIHAALVATDNGDGEILLFGGDNHDLAAARANQFDHAPVQLPEPEPAARLCPCSGVRPVLLTDMLLLVMAG